MIDTSSQNKRILVIDDDQDIWKAYGQVLDPSPEEENSSLGRLNQLIGSQPTMNRPTFSVNYAGQGKEGFELTMKAIDKKQPYAVAFIDVRMPPGWDGMETATRIRQMDDDIEIVIVTAFSDRSRDEIVAAVGGCDKLLFIRKPFDAEELLQLAASLTDKWQITQDERRQRQRLQTILCTSPAAIFTLTSEGTLSSWNAKAEEMSGYSKAEVEGHTLFSWQDKSSRPHIVETAPGIPQLGSQELTITSRGGETIIVAMKIDKNENENGPATLIGSFWDITALKKTEQALLASETRFRSLVESTSDWVWEMDSEGRFSYCSPICEELYGYQASELLGSYFYDKLLPAESREEIRAIFHECCEEGKLCRASERLCRCKDGSLIYVESSGVPIFNKNGLVTGYRGIDRDISKRKKHEEELHFLEEQQRQSQKLGALGTLAGGIAHDMNNILTPILGFSELAMLQTEPGSSLQQQIQNIHDCSTKAADLIRQILAFTRKQPMRLDSLNVNEVINDFSKMLRRLIREDIELIFDLQDDLWPIAADRSQMEQILVNLIVNARDAMESFGSSITITTKTIHLPANSLFDVNHQPLPQGDFILLQVQDDGIGMERQCMERIFDPFYTTKKAGKGTGLGLSTVFGIVGQHQGYICLLSAPGRGSSFQIYLPSTNPKSADTTQNNATVPLQKGEETILLVEDNPEVRNMLATILTELGYQIITASNGQRGLDIFKEHDAIALIISDVVMPVMGGGEMAKQIRKISPQQPFLFITGHTFDNNIHNLLDSPNSLLIEKPFSLNDVAHGIRKLLS